LQEKEPVLNAERAVITASRSLVTKQTEKGTILMHRYGKRMTFQKVIKSPGRLTFKCWVFASFSASRITCRDSARRRLSNSAT